MSRRLCRSAQPISREIGRKTSSFQFSEPSKGTTSARRPADYLWRLRGRESAVFGNISRRVLRRGQTTWNFFSCGSYCRSGPLAFTTVFVENSRCTCSTARCLHASEGRLGSARPRTRWPHSHGSHSRYRNAQMRFKGDFSVSPRSGVPHRSHRLPLVEKIDRKKGPPDRGRRTLLSARCWRRRPLRVLLRLSGIRPGSYAERCSNDAPLDLRRAAGTSRASGHRATRTCYAQESWSL